MYNNLSKNVGLKFKSYYGFQKDCTLRDIMDSWLKPNPFQILKGFVHLKTIDTAKLTCQLESSCYD